MKYVTRVTEYAPKADHMAEQIEKISNEMLEKNYELVSVLCTLSAKAILVFKSI